MARYFIDYLVDGLILPDTEGEDFTSLAEAKTEAQAGLFDVARRYLPLRSRHILTATINDGQGACHTVSLNLISMLS